MNLPEDVVSFVSARFSGADQAEVRALLVEAPVEGTSQSPARLMRCAVVASSGSLDSLRHYISLLSIDWRDVIVAGEYESQGKELVRIRDLTQPLQV